MIQGRAGNFTMLKVWICCYREWHTESKMKFGSLALLMQSVSWKTHPQPLYRQEWRKPVMSISTGWNWEKLVWTLQEALKIHCKNSNCFSRRLQSGLKQKWSQMGLMDWCLRGTEGMRVKIKTQMRSVHYGACGVQIESVLSTRESEEKRFQGMTQLECGHANKWLSWSEMEVTGVQQL